MNAPGCNYPVPLIGSKDWPALAAMFRGMGREAHMRAMEIRALDDPEEDKRRAETAAYASAYHFAALMIECQLEPVP